MAAQNGIQNGDDGFGFAEQGWPSDRQVTGRDLMCLVAGSEKFQQGFDKSQKVPLNCDAQGLRREALLSIWSSARGAQMPLDMVKKVLDLAVEKNVVLVGKKLNLWIPKNEGHLTFYSEELNKEESSVRNIDALASPKGLFVDIGSGLGLSTLAVSILYPQATVFSIEPAMPSWLLQRISLGCNLEPDAKLPHTIMSGVGAKPDGMLKMRWSPSASEKTRAWTPASERTKDDIELTVGLRTLRSIMAEAAADANVNLAEANIVLNIDCEGCEYNVVPALDEKDFIKINAIIGTTGVHWGYIPKDKLPSTKRGKDTHERLCSHYDFARRSIECCDFPNLEVKHEGNPTVSDLLGDLCFNFTKWADEKNLYTSTDDYGWTELTGMADVDV
jgi:FkbM family methyltransferase